MSIFCCWPGLKLAINTTAHSCCQIARTKTYKVSLIMPQNKNSRNTKLWKSVCCSFKIQVLPYVGELLTNQ